MIEYEIDSIAIILADWMSGDVAKFPKDGMGQGDKILTLEDFKKYDFSKDAFDELKVKKKHGPMGKLPP